METFMIKFLCSHELIVHNDLAIGMFTDRAKQFSQRLGWDVKVDQKGLERDQYESCGPIYVIEHDANDVHCASMRLLPTTGRTMLNDHFRAAYDGPEISEPDTWECTRFCIAKGADRLAVLRLLTAGARLMHELNIKRYVATFDGRMQRVYEALNVSPKILGSTCTKHGQVNVGVWHFSRETYSDLLNESCINQLQLELAIVNSNIPGVKKALMGEKGYRPSGATL